MQALIKGLDYSLTSLGHSSFVHIISRGQEVAFHPRRYLYNSIMKQEYELANDLSFIFLFL